MKPTRIDYANPKRCGQLAALLAIIATAAACGSGGKNSGTSSQSSPPPQKTLSSIAVTPANATLFLNTQQQLVAIASYSDGSTQDVTGSAQWSSSSPAIASVSGSGVLSAMAAGTATISVSSSSVSASATITVSSSTSGVAIVDDLTDARLMSFWPGDGSFLTYYGTRNSDGSIAAITSVRVTSNQQSSVFTFDAEERESTALLYDGTQMGFDWTNPSNPTLALIAPDQSGVQTVGCSTAPGGSDRFENAFLRPPKVNSRRNFRLARTMAANSGNPSAALINVSSDCGSGPKPEDNAIVNVDVSYAFGGGPPGPIPAWSLGSGTGEYYANVPSGPTSVTPKALQSSAAQALAGLCAVPIPSFTYTLCGPYAPECQAAGTAFSYVCKAQSAIQGSFSVVNFLNQLAPPTVTADVSVDGFPPASAAYQGINFGAYVFQAGPFKCNVDKVFVAPNPASVTVGQSVPLGAYATGLDATSVPYVITSSVLRWSWQPNPSDTYVQLTPYGTPTANGYQATKIGVALANVSGQTATPPASPDTVTAIESNSGISGTSQVTVQGMLEFYLLAQLTYPGSANTINSAINDNGDVVGNYQDNNSLHHGFLYSGGNYTSIDYPGSVAPQGTDAYGISASGLITGDTYLGGAFPSFIYDQGSFTPFNDPTCMGATHFQSVNDYGQGIGYCGYSVANASSWFFFNGSTYVPIAYPGAAYMSLNKINNAGQIIGTANFSQSSVAFVYANGAFTTITPPGATLTSGCSINNNGDILVASDAGSFLYTAKHTIPVDNGFGLTSSCPAYDMNNGEQVVISNYILVMR